MCGFLIWPTVVKQSIYSLKVSGCAASALWVLRFCAYHYSLSHICKHTQPDIVAVLVNGPVGLDS